MKSIIACLALAIAFLSSSPISAFELQRTPGHSAPRLQLSESTLGASGPADSKRFAELKVERYWTMIALSSVGALLTLASIPVSWLVIDGEGPGIFIAAPLLGVVGPLLHSIASFRASRYLMNSGVSIQATAAILGLTFASFHVIASGLAPLSGLAYPLVTGFASSLSIAVLLSCILQFATDQRGLKRHFQTRASQRHRPQVAVLPRAEKRGASMSLLLLF